MDVFRCSIFRRQHVSLLFLVSPHDSGVLHFFVYLYLPSVFLILGPKVKVDEIAMVGGVGCEFLSSLNHISKRCEMCDIFDRVPAATEISTSSQPDTRDARRVRNPYVLSDLSGSAEGHTDLDRRFKADQRVLAATNRSRYFHGVSDHTHQETASGSISVFSNLHATGQHEC